MPTDEQRKRFEEWEQTEAAAFLDDPDHCNYSLAEAVWLHAWLARDAEVQVLREALRKIAWLDTGENSSHSDALDALTKIEIIAFAALRGEGAGGQ